MRTGPVPPPSRRIAHILALGLLALLGGCASPPPPSQLLGVPSGKLEVHLIDVGQGDAILVRCPEGIHEMLIDSGDTRYPGSSAKFKTYMEKHQAKQNQIEVVVASHPHADHIGNMQWVVENYPIGLYVDSGMKATTAGYKKLMNAVELHHVAHKTAQDAQIPEIKFCTLPEVKARILRPAHYAEDEDDPNNVSVIVRIDYKDQSFLFVGDCEGPEEQLLMNDPETEKLLKCDFLKAGHHGSNTSSSAEFLNHVQPKFVGVSCGEKGVGTNIKYKHPRFETLKSLLGHADPREGPAVTVDAYATQDGVWKTIKLNAAVYVTQGQGDLDFECDGKEIHKK
jgi:competence protein ComEC